MFWAKKWGSPKLPQTSILHWPRDISACMTGIQCRPRDKVMAYLDRCSSWPMLSKNWFDDIAQAHLAVRKTFSFVEITSVRLLTVSALAKEPGVWKLGSGISSVPHPPKTSRTDDASGDDKCQWFGRGSRSSLTTPSELRSHNSCYRLRMPKKLVPTECQYNGWK